MNDHFWTTTHVRCVGCKRAVERAELSQHRSECAQFRSEMLRRVPLASS